MASKRKNIPSPMESAIAHAGISFVTFAALTAAGATVIHITGDEGRAGPREVVGLFAMSEGAKPSLKARLPDESSSQTGSTGMGHAGGPGVDGADTEEPSLDVPDPYGDTIAVASASVDETDRAGAGGVTVSSMPVALPAAPLAGYYETGAYGRLPKIGDDGRTPAEVYARSFANPAGRPTISIVLGGLGLNARLTQAAIDELPPEVTLSFVPYSRGLQTWVDRAREAGHEVLLELPMEPYDYPNNDTGPYTLLTTAGVDENRRRLDWLLSQATGYFGVTNYQGAKFATDANAAGPIMEALKDRGMVFVHDNGAPRSVLEQEARDTGVKFAKADRVIDTNPSATFVDEQLLHLEAIALQRGSALGSGFAYPVTIDQLRDWTSTLEMKGYRLAPASTLPRNRVVMAEGAGQES